MCTRSQQNTMAWGVAAEVDLSNDTRETQRESYIEQGGADP